jgi:hypothetical protein
MDRNIDELGVVDRPARTNLVLVEFGRGRAVQRLELDEGTRRLTIEL